MKPAKAIRTLTPAEREALAAIATAYRLVLEPPRPMHFEFSARGLIELEPIGGAGDRAAWRRDPSARRDRWRATITAAGRAALEEP